MRDSTKLKKKEIEISPLRVPPSNVRAERGLLGSILLDGTRVMDLCAAIGLVQEAFYVPEHATLYEVLRQLYVIGVQIDAITVTERLTASNLLEKVGGVEQVEKLIEETPTSAHAEYYIDIVRQKFLLRTILNTVRKTESACFDETNSADLILSQAEQAFLNITENAADGSRLTWQGAIQSTIDHVERLFRLGPGAVSGLSTGFINLDAVTHGLRNGEMIVLAARPSQGKTSLAMNIAEFVALGVMNSGAPMKGDSARKHPVAVFSVEMSQESLALRMLCGRARVSADHIEKGMINKANATNLLTRAASELLHAPIYVDDTGGLDVMEMRARARRLKKKHKIELIVIDYLQLLNHREFAKQGRQIETSQISANVKAMAKELNIPVIVLSQLSRGPEQRDLKSAKPKCSDLRDSGAIEQDADVIMLLRRPCKYPGDPRHEEEKLAIIDVAKHRNGPTGEVELQFDGQWTRFSDPVERPYATDAFVANAVPVDAP